MTHPKVPDDLHGADGWYDVEVWSDDQIGISREGKTAGIALDGVPMRGVIRTTTEIDVHNANRVTVVFYAKSVNKAGEERSA